VSTGFLVRNPKNKRPLGRHRLRLRIILKWILKKYGECGLDSLGSGQVPLASLVNTATNFRVPQKSENFLSI
jgi:hypothetical protein